MALFLAMVFFLQKFLFKPLMDMWDTRANLIEGNKQRAEELSSKVDQQIVYYEAQIWATRKLAQEDAEHTHRENVRHSEELLLKVKNESNEAIAELREKIAGEFKAAEQRVMDNAQAMGKMIAEKILGTSISE
jgi:F-type H+-transporting ATPase subunit b